MQGSQRKRPKRHEFYRSCAGTLQVRFSASYNFNQVKIRWAAIPLILFSMGVAAAPDSLPLAPDVQRALASISGDSLRANLSFLSSSLLEGRGTPSRGLDIAAEFI